MWLLRIAFGLGALGAILVFLPGILTSLFSLQQLAAWFGNRDHVWPMKGRGFVEQQLTALWHPLELWLSVSALLSLMVGWRCVWPPGRRRNAV
jgi:membrane glycosyltransferase